MLDLKELRPGWKSRWVPFSFPALILAGWALILPAQNLDLNRLFDERNLPPVRELLQKGEYDQAARLSELYLERGAPSPEWWLLRLESLVMLGRKDEVRRGVEAAIKAHPDDLRLLMACHDSMKAFGGKDLAVQVLQQINTAARARPAGQRQALDLVVLGRAALAAGADPQKVIEQFFAPAKKKDSRLVETYLALGELALAKSDDARAAEEFRAGLKVQPAEVRLQFGLAQAHQSGDRKKSIGLLSQVLMQNPRHPGALLMMAEHHLGAEEYDQAAQALDRVIEVNALQPRAWALRSVLATIVANDSKEADRARLEGLKIWPENPEVDFVIGRSLSRSYRFQEATDHLRKAVQFDPSHLEAQLQLCHALFRLGQEEEAWKLAAGIRRADAYNVQAFNIGLLEAEMKGFHVRREPDFVLKMPKRDAAVYGDRALVLLREARQVLGEKYGLALDHPVLVEFFPSQQDFAIRTFGNLGGQGILGACFGTVVTMNSPGSVAANRSNWESTLWHEFCHVVTLSVTRNRMPRWLSEGISVHEEQQRDPAWGMRMSASYRKMALDPETLTPLSKMSGAFLAPESSEHLMFAYYEAAQAVGWLLSAYGEARFKGLLGDLASGIRINEALERNMEPVSRLDAAFAKHMETLAQNLAPGADWYEPEPHEVDPRNPAAVAAFARMRPTNLWALRQQVMGFLASERWTEALEGARRLIALFPQDEGSAGGFGLAAQACRGMKDSAGEAAMLREWASRSGDASTAFLRLIELDQAAANWSAVLENARRMMAIDPFLKRPHEAMAAACEALGDRDGAVAALRKLHTLGADNPVQVNFALARLLREAEPETARRHLLDALAEAPRFREGHVLLLEIQKPEP